MNGISLRGRMWINDLERERGFVDVKGIEFTVDCVVGSGAVTESEGTTALKICHPTNIGSSIISQSTAIKDGGTTGMNSHHPTILWTKTNEEIEEKKRRKRKIGEKRRYKITSEVSTGVQL